MKIKRILLLSLTLLAAPCAGAQSLNECLEYALSHSLRIRRAGLSEEKARTLEKTAFDIGRTELSLSQDPTSGGSPDNAVTLSQEFEFPTVYSGRRKLLEAGTRVEESKRLLTESELRRDVSSAYCDLLLRRHVTDLLRQNGEILEEFVSTARARYEEGETGRLEVLGATRMKAENDIRLREALDLEHEASLSLRLLMNSGEEIVPTDAYVCIPEDGGDFSFNRTPEGLLSQSELGQSERSLSLARREGFLPSFSMGLSRQFVISGLNPYGVDRSAFDKGNWMGFQAGVSVPLFFGPQRKKVAAARLDVQMAQAQLEEQRNASLVRLAAAADRLGTARDTYGYYLEQALPQAGELRQLAGLEYASGNISYSEYIQNLSTALETEMAGAVAADKLNQAIIEMNFIKGNQVVK